MKFKQLLTKTLLAAVCLLVGQSAWGAVEITETYDFGTFVAGGAPALTTSGDAIAQSGTSAKVGSVYLINNPTSTESSVTLDLKGRFAVDYNSSAGSQIRFMWRKDGTAYKNGLAGNWNGNGTADSQGAARFSVLNLKKDDKITFTYAKQSGKAADPYTCSASQLTGVGVDVALASGTQYTVAADGNVDLYFTNNNFAISKIVIVTYGTETVSAPTMSITGADAKARKVTITAGTSDAGNDVTTYYTTDGSTPTTSSASFTTASQEIIVGAGAESESTVTVKAFSVSSASAESSVTSQNVTVGTLVQLAAPTISMSSFASADGLIYNPVYTFTSDQSGVTGTPSVTYSYSFAGGASTAGTSYTASSSGNITVTVSADGYESNSTVLSIVGGNYAKTYSFDATKDVTVDTSTGTWENASSVGGVQWTFTSLDNCTYSLRAGITLTGFMYARATTAQTKEGLYARLGSGSVGFSLTDGEYVVFGMRGGTNNIANSGATSKSFGQYSNIRSIEIFTPATDVDIAILDCKQHETSAAFATAVDAESFSTADKVYAFHTDWQIAQAEAASSNDITKVIRNAAITSTTDWVGSRVIELSTEKYDGAPDNFLIDANNQEMDTYQMLYGLPAGKYRIKAATRANEGVTSGKIYVYADGQVDKNADGNHIGNQNGDLGHGWSWTSIDFELTSTSNVKIGYYVNAIGSGKWASCDDWHLYKLPENVTKTITSAGWATYCSPYALDLSNATGLTDAYIVTGGSEGVLTKTSVKDGTVPANTGLLLKGAAGTVTIPVVTSSSTDVTANKFVGVTAETVITAEDGYVLMNDETNGLGFYKNSNAFTVGANTAYLPASFDDGGARASYLLFDDMTGISQVAGSEVKTNGVIYNLNGQRVSNPTKGIYIIDGLKVAIE